MKKLVIGMALASTVLASPALAREGAWYVELDGGVMLLEDMDYDINAFNNAVTVDSDYGYDFGGIVGYDFGAFRLEAEVSYREADPDDFVVSTGGLVPTTVLGRAGPGTYNVAGDTNALAFMVNGLLDFGDDDGLQGFIGGGVGVARIDADLSINNVGGGYVNDSDTRFAWQGLAGIRAPLTENWDVGVKYRFFNADKIRLVDSLGRDSETRFRSHSVLGTIAYNFGGAPEPMPEPAYVPPPPPPPPPVYVPPPPPPPPPAPDIRAGERG